MRLKPPKLREVRPAPSAEEKPRLREGRPGAHVGRGREGPLQEAGVRRKAVACLPAPRGAHAHLVAQLLGLLLQHGAALLVPADVRVVTKPLHVLQFLMGNFQLLLVVVMLLNLHFEVLQLLLGQCFQQPTLPNTPFTCKAPPCAAAHQGPAVLAQREAASADRAHRVPTGNHQRRERCRGKEGKVPGKAYLL